MSEAALLAEDNRTARFFLFHFFCSFPQIEKSQAAAARRGQAAIIYSVTDFEPFVIPFFKNSNIFLRKTRENRKTGPDVPGYARGFRRMPVCGGEILPS